MSSHAGLAAGGIQSPVLLFSCKSKKIFGIKGVIIKKLGGRKKIFCKIRREIFGEKEKKNVSLQAKSKSY
jgi:hypothetical protein